MIAGRFGLRLSIQIRMGVWVFTVQVRGHAMETRSHSMAWAGPGLDITICSVTSITTEFDRQSQADSNCIIRFAT